MENEFLKAQLKSFWQVFNSRNEKGKIFWFGQGTEIGNKIAYNDAPGSFNLRYREVACNWLICAVFDFVFKGPFYFDEASQDDCDGYIIGPDGITLAVEQVMSYNHKTVISNEEEKNNFIQKSILSKLEKGEQYLTNKLLVVDIKIISDIMTLDIKKLLDFNKPVFLPRNIIFISCKEDETWRQVWNVSLYNSNILSNKKSITSYEVNLDLKKFTWSINKSLYTN